MHDLHPVAPSPHPVAVGPVAELALSRERFLGFLFRQTGDYALAEEILHNGFARALQAEESLRDEESAPAWFYRLLRNAVVDHHRRIDAEERALRALHREPVAPPEQPDAHILADVCNCLVPLLDSLPESYAEILREVDLKDCSPKEYAEAHGISRNNATVRLHRARQALRERASACCGANCDGHCGGQGPGHS